MIGKLSVVGTPIGNLEDVTLRALRTLKEADSVACEDTRVTRKLLTHFGIQTPAVNLQQVPRLLAQGKHVALVSDAGTPGVSDPAAEIVSRARSAGAAIDAIPGTSALSTALSICGLRASSFVFYGFLPQKKGREKILSAIAQDRRASVLFESPHRIVKTLVFFAARLSVGRRIGVFRELTKIHEEHLVGSPEAVLHALTTDKQRGEFVVIVEGTTK